MALIQIVNEISIIGLNSDNDQILCTENNATWKKYSK